MFAIIALICFVLALFHVVLGSVDLVVLGFCFIALHLIFGAVIALPNWRRAP
jgi:hypothetical protein